MKITQRELQEMIREAVRKKLQQKRKKKLQEGSSFTARRVIDEIIPTKAREFEADIISNLGILGPDELRPEMQVKYLAIAEEMREGFRQAARAAVRKLQNFPKKEDESSND